AVQIDAQNTLPDTGLDLPDRGCALNAGIVDEAIDVYPFLAEYPRELVDLLLTRDVDRMEFDSRSLLRRKRLEPSRQVVGAAVAHDDISTFIEEACDDRRAEAAEPARDQRGGAFVCHACGCRTRSRRCQSARSPSE